MTKNRLEAFSDGVFAIIITIMVLELHPPREATWNSLAPLAPKFLSYLLSFINVSIYWNNHHHLMHVVQRINGRVLWSNAMLLFWLSLFPLVTDWLGEFPGEPVPVAVYGGVLWLAGVAYYVLTRSLISAHSANTSLSQAVGKDTKGLVSVVLYTAAIALAFVQTWLSIGLYCVVAAIWFVPDLRVEKVLKTTRMGLNEGDAQKPPATSTDVRAQT